MKIVGSIIEGSKLSGLLVLASVASLRKINFVVAGANPSNVSYEHILSFSSLEARRLDGPHDDTLVISLNVANVLLKRTLVDLGSLVNFLFAIALTDVELEDLKIDDVSISLVEFSREQGKFRCQFM